MNPPATTFAPQLAFGQAPPRAHEGDLFRLVVPNTRSAARLARDFVSGLLRVSDHGELVDNARLCVTELVANAHRHTHTRMIGVDTVVGCGRTTVYVTDYRPLSLPEAPPSRSQPQRERCDGRGLLLLQQLVHAWGVTLYNGGSHDACIDRKAVWFTLARCVEPGEVHAAA